MKKYVLVMLIMLFVSCNGQQTKEETKGNIEEKPTILIAEKEKKKSYIKDLEEFKLKNDSSKTYAITKAEIKKAKALLKNNAIEKDSLAIIFKQSLLYKVIPFWQGTVWSFEGHTSIPKKGEIACGYFVSTTLEHVGVNLNRYALAQQSPINEAKSLAVNTKVLEVATGSLKGDILKIKESIPEGIHFVGFDQSHVGYILKEKDELYIIHSNYIDNKGVVIEKVEESMVFSFFERFYIVELSTNESFLRNWITGKELAIVKK